MTRRIELLGAGEAGMPTERCWVEVDLHALRDNLSWLRHRVGAERRIITVVKADAYGHGLREIAGCLMQSGTDMLGVANLQEGMRVKRVGPGWPVLILGASLASELGPAIRENIMLTASSVAELREMEKQAGKVGRAAGIHLKQDTGMGRLGLFPSELGEALAFLKQSRWLSFQGFFTHFSSAESDPTWTAIQWESFQGGVQQVQKIFGTPSEGGPWIHAANSAGILLEERYLADAVRPGLLVYGLLPEADAGPVAEWVPRLRPVLSWKARLTLVRAVPAGTPISYGAIFVTPRAMRVGVISAGYGDGYPRAAGEGGFVEIQGHRVPIIGRITMDQMMVDLGELEVRPGEEVLLMGGEGKNAIQASELARQAGTISWEILTGISYRVRRHYRGGTAS